MFIFMYLALLLAFGCQETVFSEQRCNIEYQSGCASRVTATFEDKVLEGRKEFNIIHEFQTKQETIATCEWPKSGQFSCNPANGFKCDNQLSKNFSCDIENCFKSGEFLFDVEDMDIIRCEIHPNESNVDQMVTTSTSNPNNSNSEHQNEEKKSLGITIWFCGAVGGLLLVGIVIFVVVKIKRQVSRKRSSPQEMSTEASSQESNASGLKQNIRPPKSETGLHNQSTLSVRVHLEDIKDVDYEENGVSWNIQSGVPDEDDVDLPFIGNTDDVDTKP